MFFYEGAVKVCHARCSGSLRSDQTASRLPFAIGPVPKRKQDHTRNEAHEIIIKGRFRGSDGYPLLCYKHTYDRPVDCKELDDDKVDDHRSHRPRQRRQPLRAFANCGNSFHVRGDDLGHVGCDDRCFSLLTLDLRLHFRLGM